MCCLICPSSASCHMERTNLHTVFTNNVTNTFNIILFPLIQGSNPSQAVNLVPDVKLAEFDTPEAPPSTGGIVSWSPPQQNWNPWTSCNLDEGPLASVSTWLHDVILWLTKTTQWGHVSSRQSLNPEKRMFIFTSINLFVISCWNCSCKTLKKAGNNCLIPVKHFLKEQHFVALYILFWFCLWAAPEDIQEGLFIVFLRH